MSDPSDAAYARAGELIARWLEAVADADALATTA